MSCFFGKDPILGAKNSVLKSSSYTNYLEKEFSSEYKVSKGAKMRNRYNQVLEG